MAKFVSARSLQRPLEAITRSLGEQPTATTATTTTTTTTATTAILTGSAISHEAAPQQHVDGTHVAQHLVQQQITSPSDGSHFPALNDSNYSASDHRSPTAAANSAIASTFFGGSPSTFGVLPEFPRCCSPRCILTYNMFVSCTEAATPLHSREHSSSKTQFHKSLNVGGRWDMRSSCYLTLLLLIYCCVLLRAVAATGNLANTFAEASAIQAAPVVSPSAEGGSMRTANSNMTAFMAEAVVGRNSANLPDRQRDGRSLRRRDVANVPDADDDDSSYNDDDFDEYDALVNNKSAKGKYIGAACNEMKCEPTLMHVTCDKETLTCVCEKNYPVQLGLIKGCDKPKKLGEQCFYDETCMYNDENSLCVQVRHNALCQCASGFHSVSYTRPTRRVFCTQDLKEGKSDLPTLLGVAAGIGVLAGLICMVLHLFSKTKYPRHRHFGDANLPPPIMYSSETGIPLTVQSGRPSSRSSLRSSGGSIGSYGNRRRSSAGGANAGSAGTKGILVSTSRTGAARSAAILLISCHVSALSKQTSRQTSGAGCSANSRDNLDEHASEAGSRSCDSTLSMTRHLQKQLNHQRHLLSFELSPAKTKSHDRLRALLGLNGIDNYRTAEDDLNSLGHDGGHLEIGALPTPASETPRFAVLEDQV